MAGMKSAFLIVFSALLATGAHSSPQLEAGPLGAVEVGEGEAVHIRSLLSLTGAPSLGASLRHGVELAVRDVGDVHGHPIELGDPLDSECSPDGGREGAERIAADPRVVGVVGTSCSAAAVAASPVIGKAGLVMVSPSNTSPVLTSDLRGNPGSHHHAGYFRVSKQRPPRSSRGRRLRLR